MKRTFGLTSFGSSSNACGSKRPQRRLRNWSIGAVLIVGVAGCGGGGTEEPLGSVESVDEPAEEAAPAANDEPSSPAEQPSASGAVGGFNPDFEGSVAALTTVTGRAMLEDGSAVEQGAFVQVCGSTCFNGNVGTAGAFQVQVALDVSGEAFAVSVKGGQNYAKFYFALPPGSSTGTVEMGELTLLPLPGSGEELPNGSVEADTSFTSGGVTLDLVAGNSVELDFDALAGDPIDKSFRASYFPGAEVADALDFTADHFFTLAPFETSFEDANGETIGPRLTFELEGATAGQEFEMFALGSYLFPDFLPAAQFGKLADVVVNDAGQVVVEDEISLFTWVAFVAK